MKVKICGITNIEDALAAIEYGADVLGFVFAPSPRQVTPEQVISIVAKLPPFVCKVGVFVDSSIEIVQETMSACNLNLCQLHGAESPGFCRSLFPRSIKAFRVKDKSILQLLTQYQTSAYLLDSYDATLKGGTGKCFNWDIAKRASEHGRIILSGGLSPDNVLQAIQSVQPYAVDVSSGVESRPGKKDRAKLSEFISTAKSSDTC